jgi:hypothetical protein
MCRLLPAWIYLCIFNSRIHCFEFLHSYINPHPLLNFQVLDRLYIGRYCVVITPAWMHFNPLCCWLPQTFVVNFSVENKPTKAQIPETPILFCWCPLSFSSMFLTIVAPLVKLSESQLSFVQIKQTQFTLPS